MDEAGKRNVLVLGGQAQSGTYILRLLATKPLAIRFGRFRNGETVALAPGDYLYVGSAMGQKGASSLARRLVRHATRSGEGAPHAIRATMLAEFAQRGLGNGDLRPRRAKRLFWHIDYLLDAPGVNLTHVLALRSHVRLEQDVAELLAGQPYCALPVRGLGASDTPDGTHLLAVAPELGWWQALQDTIGRHWG